jgi:pyruvate-ferredoxin/flavodoxin oxidoreductase
MPEVKQVPSAKAVHQPGGVGKLVRRWLAGEAGQPAREPGEPRGLTALDAVSLLESAAGARRVTGADLAREIAGDGGLHDGWTGGLAVGLGLALGGERVAVFLSARELQASVMTLSEAVRRRVPLVVYSVGGDLETAAAAARSGAAVWLPDSVAGALDAAVAGRRFAEEALAAVVLGLEGPGLARSVQEGWMPSSRSLGQWLGSPADTVHPANLEQRRLFGDHRRRVPRWHDPSQPVRLGGADGASAAAAFAAGEVLAAVPNEEILESALRFVSAATGRALERVSGAAAGKTEVLLVGSGSTAETLRALAGCGKALGVKMRWVTVRGLAPFAGARLAELAQGASTVAVVERVTTPGQEGPLFGLVRSALATHGSKAACNSLLVPGADSELRLGDLAVAVRGLHERARPRAPRTPRTPRTIVGLASVGGRDYPKQRALIDSLRHDGAEFEHLGARGEADFDSRPAGAVSFGLVRDGFSASFAAEAARLCLEVAGGSMRSRLGKRAPSSGEPALDVWTWSPGESGALADPGDDVALDCLLLLGDAVPSCVRLAREVAVLVSERRVALPPAMSQRVAAGEVALWSVPAPEAEAASGAGTTLAREAWLGAMLAALARQTGSEIKPRALKAARAALLDARQPLEPRKPIEPLQDDARDRRVAACLRGFEETRRQVGEIGVHPASPAAPPVALAAFAGGGQGTRRNEDGALGSAVEFWDQIGLPTSEGQADRLVPDAVLGVRALPPSAAARGRATLETPAFDPTLCTGCGACWSLCPHGAIAARILEPAALLDRAVSEAGRSGEPLRRFAGKIAARWSQAIRAVGGADAGPSLSGAADAVLAAAGLSAERLGEARAASASVAARLGILQLAASEFFSQELVTLAVDPDLCTSCGLCIEVCEPDALRPACLDEAGLAQARSRALALGSLPPTAPAVIERARATSVIGALAGGMLSPLATGVLAGVDGAEPGSGARLALRQLLGLAAMHAAQARRDVVERCAGAAAELGRAVHGQLEGALPDRDLAALARGLDEVSLAASDIGDVVGRVTAAVEGSKVDVPRLRRLVEAARATADLGGKLRADEPGTRTLPRATLSLVIGPGSELAWARGAVENPFGVPVTIANDAPVAVGVGLARAETLRAVAEARVLRRARLELDRPAAASAGEDPLARLAWSDLDDAERTLATRVFVAVEEGLAGAEMETAFLALAEDLPLAILTLAAPAAAPSRTDSVPSAWAAFAFAAPAAVVAHASVAHGDSLDQAARAAVTARGGAIVRVLAPSPRRDGLAANDVLSRARGAVEAREFPLGCRTTAISNAATAPRVDPNVEIAELERRATDERTALERRHREELARVESEVRQRLAESARARLLELAARRRAAEPPAAEVS